MSDLFLLLPFFWGFLNKKLETFLRDAHASCTCSMTALPSDLELHEETLSSTLSAQHVGNSKVRCNIAAWHVSLDPCFGFLSFLLQFFCSFSPLHAVQWRGTSGCERILLIHSKICCFFFSNSVWLIIWDFQKQTLCCGKYLWWWSGGLQIIFALKCKLTAKNKVLNLK